MAKQWSQDSRKQQREHIMNHQPWNNSTGPKSESGKKISSQNAHKGKTPLRSIQKMITNVHKERLELLRYLERTYGLKVKY